jgi:hypothetical protein
MTDRQRSAAMHIATEIAHNLVEDIDQDEN